MKLIAHRGNFLGKKNNLENEPNYLLNAIEAGYDIEVDIWLVDHILYFGHDKPEYKVSGNYLNDVEKHAWFHCKNLNSLLYFNQHYPAFTYFWHESDKFTLTSNGYIWTYPGQPLSNRSISVLPSKFDFDVIPYGICSDDFRSLNV